MLPEPCPRSKRASCRNSDRRVSSALIQHSGSGGNLGSGESTKHRSVRSVDLPSTLSRSTLAPVWLGATPWPL